jgi:hypothetical protein
MKQRLSYFYGIVYKRISTTLYIVLGSDILFCEKKKRKKNNQRIFPQTVGIPMGISCVLIFYGIVYFNLSGIDAIKIIIKLRIIQ